MTLVQKTNYPSECYIFILDNLSPRELSIVSLVCSQLHLSASSDSLWEKFCAARNIQVKRGVSCKQAFTRYARRYCSLFFSLFPHPSLPNCSNAFEIKEIIDRGFQLGMEVSFMQIERAFDEGAPVELIRLMVSNCHENLDDFYLSLFDRLFAGEKMRAAFWLKKYVEAGIKVHGELIFYGLNRDIPLSLLEILLPAFNHKKLIDVTNDQIISIIRF